MWVCKREYDKGINKRACAKQASKVIHKDKTLKNATVTSEDHSVMEDIAPCYLQSFFTVGHQGKIWITCAYRPTL